MVDFHFKRTASLSITCWYCLQQPVEGIFQRKYSHACSKSQRREAIFLGCVISFTFYFVANINWTISLFHFVGETIDIVGTNTNTLGCTCEIHSWLDTLLCSRSSEISLRGTVISVFWVLVGIHCCCVGFLWRNCVPNAEYHYGELVQVVELYSLGNESTIHRKTFHCNMCYCVGTMTAPGLKCLHKHECNGSAERKHDGKGNKFDGENDEAI